MQVDVEYDYELVYCPYYSDDQGIHYPSAGHKFVNANIIEVNVGHDHVLSLPNCYSLRAPDGTIYEWKTGITDYTELHHGGVAHIITTFEVPVSFTTSAVIWNMHSVNAEHVDL